MACLECLNFICDNCLFHFLQDIIPPAYLDELSLLQDRIAPFSTEAAFNIIEKELGLPLDMIFSEISPETVAAASLGQVRSVYHFFKCIYGPIDGS